MGSTRRATSASPAPVSAADLLRILDEVTPLPAGSWARWVARELREDQHARLDHVGRPPEAAIHLARVFVDVAVSRSSAGDEEDAEAPATSKAAVGAVEHLLSVRPVLHGAIHTEENLAERSVLRPPLRRPQRAASFLLIGGPGQGKSTLSQVLCQVFRAEILAPAEGVLDEADRNALRSLRDDASALALPSPAAPCLPLRIILRDFAAWLFQEGAGVPNALPAFIASRMSRLLGNVAVPPEAHLLAISHVPWLLVLDGLDEVPVSGGRFKMLVAIRAFLNSPEAQRSPSLVVATTRPQGYGGELGDFETLHLLGLSHARMWMFATRLVTARYPGADERQAEILERLQAAWQEPTGRKLLRTPLQITLMADLATQVGRIPGDRWKLFADYYRVMYARETGRSNLAHATLLDQLRAQITVLHQRAGLWLQIRSEQSGSTDALLSRDELAGLVDAVLLEDYEDAGERARLVEDVLQAAVERLVFLVQSQEGKYGFEIRSLQEWMAAEALLNGSEADVKERLKHVAPVQAWRNVVLFAAGKCFADLFHLADFVVNELCTWLNDECEHPEVRATLTGSELALDILQDGAVREQRGRAKKLAQIALRLLDLPPAEVHERLAIMGGREFEPLLRGDIERRMQGGPEEHRLAAWVTLLVLTHGQGHWPVEIADRCWPRDGSALPSIMRAMIDAQAPASAWFLEKLSLHRKHIPPGALQGLVVLDDTPRPGWLSGLQAVFDDDEHRGPDEDGFPLLDQPGGGLMLGLPESFAPASLIFEDAPPAWRPLVAAARFLRQPTPSRLAEELRYLALGFDDRTVERFWWSFPWQLLLALREATSELELLLLADRIEAGENGDERAWEAAEQAWKQGLRVEDVISQTEIWPTSRQSRPAFPWRAGILYSRLDDHGALVQQALTAFRALPTGSTSAAAAAWFILSLMNLSPKTKLLVTPSEARAIFVAARLPPWTRVRFWPSLSDQTSAEWVELFTSLLREGTKVHSRWGAYYLRAWLERAYSAYPSAHPLLCALARSRSASASRPPDVPVELLDPTRFSAGSEEQLCATLVRFGLGNLSAIEEEHLASALAAGVTSTEDALDLVRSHLLHHRSDEPPPASVHLLLLFLARLKPAHWQFTSMALSGLRTHRDLLRTSLSDSATAARLHLPAPPPPARSPSDPAPAAEGVFRFHSISFSGLRPFRQATLSLPPPTPTPLSSPQTEEAPGQWIILIGENGTGKSTFLRGLVFALADTSAANGALAKAPAPYRREGESPARIEITASSGAFTATISEDPSTGRETLTLGRKNGGRRPFLVAYGCQRGSALGGPALEPPYPPETDIVTLFDETRGLIHAEVWLNKLWVGASKDLDGPDAARFHTVVDVLKEVLRLDTLDVQGDGVWVTRKPDEPASSEHPPETRTRLAGLSDGYLTTAGWIIDLMARWIDRASRLKQELPRHFNRFMEGLVLVDEVDLHLHPRWQRRLLQDLRGAFPRLSFVVTTHHPLTLLTAREGEIFALVRDPRAGDVQVRSLDLPIGLRADQVLTGEWFGLASTLDPDTLGLLDAHRKMLRDGVSESDPARVALEAQIRKRLGSFQDTSMERLVQSVAAQLTEETYVEPTSSQRGRLRERIKQRAREKLEAQRKATQGDAE